MNKLKVADVQELLNNEMIKLNEELTRKDKDGKLVTRSRLSRRDYVCELNRRLPHGLNFRTNYGNINVELCDIDKGYIYSVIGTVVIKCKQHKVIETYEEFGRTKQYTKIIYIGKELQFTNWADENDTFEELNRRSTKSYEDELDKEEELTKVGKALRKELENKGYSFSEIDTILTRASY